MKGFIKVTGARGHDIYIKPTMIVAVSTIKGDVELHTTGGQAYDIRETEAEVLLMIEEAQKEDCVSIQYVPYYPSHPEAVPLPYIQPCPQTPQPNPLYPTYTSHLGVIDGSTHPVKIVSSPEYMPTTTEETK